MAAHEEHIHDPEADSATSMTFRRLAGSIEQDDYIVIKNRPCKVVTVEISRTGKHGHAKSYFVANDIFNGKKLLDIIPSSHYCDVPHVNFTEYQLTDINRANGFVKLLSGNGNTKDDLKLPTHDADLLKQLEDGFSKGKNLEITVMSSMGEEQICGVNEIVAPVQLNYWSRTSNSVFEFFRSFFSY